MLDENGEQVLFDTMTEISAVQYEGGRFVSYISAYASARSFAKAITINSHTTSFEHDDPVQANGVGFYAVCVATFMAASFCGWAQACADANVKKYYRLNIWDAENSNGQVTESASQEAPAQATTTIIVNASEPKGEDNFGFPNE